MSSQPPAAPAPDGDDPEKVPEPPAREENGGSGSPDPPTPSDSAPGAGGRGASRKGDGAAGSIGAGANGSADDFLADARDAFDADPDVFNPAAETAYGRECAGRGSEHYPADRDDPVYRACWKELSRLAAQIGRKRPSDMLEAAAAIRTLRKEAPESEGLSRSLAELVAIWRLIRQEMERKAPCHVDLKIPYEATELLPEGAVIPSRSAQLGGRRDPLPPADAVRPWLGRVLGTEDAVREFCCFAVMEAEVGAPPEPLLRFRGVPVMGSQIAPLYREARLLRPWDPKRDADIALLHDFILSLAVIGKGRWTTHVARTSVPRLRPYVRSVPDEMLMPTAASATGFLEGRGLLYQCGPRTWRITPEGFLIFDRHIGRAWLEAARGRP